AEVSPRPAGETWSPYGVHQAGITQPMPRFVELVALDLHAEVDRAALGRLLRQWTGDIVTLTQGRPAPGDTAPELSVSAANLTITVGLGPEVFRGDLATLRPAGLVRVPPMRHDRLRDEWTGGDVVLAVAASDGTTVTHAVRRLVSDAAPFARLRWRQTGFWNGLDDKGQAMTGRNLFGQVDGSGNPRMGTPVFDATVWIDDALWTGGSTLVVRRIRLDLDTWDELTRDEQERAVGRRLRDGAPLTGGGELDDLDLLATDNGGRLLIPEHAHSRRAHPSLNRGRRIFRKGANYTREVTNAPGAKIESGLLFLSFQADIGDQFVPLQQALDESDALNDWTTAIGSAEFAILPGFEAGGWLGSQIFG
ncbi:MAG: Dyp-type peroxidase, partial [Nocardioidaceae bacterium]